MKKNILITFITLLFIFILSGCQKKVEIKEELSFDISKNFSLIKENIEGDNVELFVSGNGDIDIYVNELKNKFINESLTFNIYIYNEDEKDFEFNEDKLENFRYRVRFNVGDEFYTKDEYIILPSNLNNETMIPFVNKNVEKTSEKIVCYIEMDTNKYELFDIVSTMAVYQEQVEKLNKVGDNVEIVVNDIYIYENPSYVIKTEKVKF